MHYYRIAVSLVLVQHISVSAFQALPNCLQQQPSITSALHTAALDSIPSLESILEDGNGQINSNLAQAIYEWELAHSKGQANKQFSTRDGLRLVDDLARDILSSLSDDDGKSGISYADLVQEGMIALMRAMSTYDNYKSHTKSSSTLSTFEEYTKESIHSSFLHFLAHSSRPIRLPLSLQTTLETANVAAEKLRETLGKEPSLVQVAKEVKIAPEQLALYRKLYRTMVSRAGTFVSVEDGMEVYDPTFAGVGMGTGLRARRDLESVVNGGDHVGEQGGGSEASSDESLSNSQEDDWSSSSRVVAPLKDVLTDTEEINNPLSYTHHHLLNEELNEFLHETLTNEELTVIQLRFGLVDSKYGGKGWTANEIGHRMGLPHEDVVRVASGALEKLRKADSDAFVEVSL
eukprot:CAMPEP_0201888884 /NCGR_PEP_ID=MMETSP0902-20130614/28651_1 /ASSEMBLY_ACC=CAM_ASM_000551 /TAXON_ID=420261 /ORGANISM="Thalassiosira antarctica, Strain CCMP982" /LENGTH=403 /DNA_ID=CAMNT_0048419275 /DNA_START=343 /DNA_END=1554 /DNA_ORIENTATION=-